jgi:hypothetical protein
MNGSPLQMAAVFTRVFFFSKTGGIVKGFWLCRLFWRLWCAAPGHRLKSCVFDVTQNMFPLEKELFLFLEKT